jgi:hypothetical protein
MKKYNFLLLSVFLLGSCATHKTKYVDNVNYTDGPTTKAIVQSVYLIGDAGLSPDNEINPVLKGFKKKLSTADENSTAIFLGDNIYPAGLPSKKDGSSNYERAINHLDAQLATLDNFDGRTLFIPGNHDWYNEGLKGLEREEKYINKKIKHKKPFLPEGGCPIDVLKVSEELAIIVIDTEWYLTNWDRHPTMNDNCGIKSRAKFWEEVEALIKKNRDKTTLIAMHHPMFSYGPHGGQFSFQQQFFLGKSKVPLPFLGSFVNVLRMTSGASREDLANKRYTEFKNRIVTLAQYSEKVIFVSGHEHSLQYIKENNTPQIVSGSGAKKGVTRLLNGSQFSTGNRGYAILEIYDDGSSVVRFYGIGEGGNEEFLFKIQVLPPKRKLHNEKYDEEFPSVATASIYKKEEIDKSGFFKTLWGERYRKYYGTKVTVPTVNLDSLYGGLKPVRKGGGHQSKSLRLRHESGKEYVMRALRKVSELYLQSMVFQKQYVMDDLEDTFLQELLADFYTGSHPYAPFTIGDLSDAVNLYHTNPKLYYIPKQSALQDFNSDFGNELYMIEEHAGNGHENLASYGYSKKLISTDEMLENLRDDERYEVDAEMYLRARLFDMTIGDWDRHVDQWRWAEFKKKKSKKKIYRPVPRDRDQAFSIMGDGLFMGLATRLVPGLRLMEGFKDEIRSVEGFNSSPKTYVLDMAVLSETTKGQWIKEAEFIQDNLTAGVIDKAFLNFPKEVRDATVTELKRVLLSRIENIKNTAEEYYKVLNKHATVVGTDKDDWFEIENLSKEETLVRVYRKINGKKKKKYFEKKFHQNDTKEIWVYGLDDEDNFEVLGNKKSKIKIRLVGGQNNDHYIVGDGGGNVSIYDYKSKKNNLKSVSKAKVRLTDQYSTNTYQPLKIRNSFNQFLPVLGFNPDSGLKLGFNNTYTYNGFAQNPFTQQHVLNAGYYFATSGFEADYKGEFANFIGKANFELALGFTTPNFAINFFGFGNETQNLDDILDLDYNRVRLGTFTISPSLVWRGQLGSIAKAGVSYEAIEVEETENRFINSYFLDSGGETQKKFIGLHAEYSYSNSDNEAFPTMGMSTSLEVGYKTEVDDGANFGYIIPSLSFDYKLIPSGKLVLATKWKAHFNVGDDFEFYQGATLGGLDGLRGFRNQRFTGKKSYYQNTDIRLSLGQKRTGILPAALGIYAGFDYGRVWLTNETSNTWHTSYGGGFFYDAANIATLRAAVFNSVDGIRLTFGLGFGF